MSWFKDFTDLVKQTITLESRVETNTKEIEALRHDLNNLTEFVNKVARAVSANKNQIKHKHELSQGEIKRLDSILAVKLENELLKLSNRLNGSEPVRTIEEHLSSQQALPSQHDRPR